MPFLCLDFTLEWARLRALDLIKCSSSRAIIWLTPPCGTLSFARDRAIPKHLLRAGASSSGPLRSNRYVAGLPNALKDAVTGPKLRRANSLVDFSFEAIRAADGVGRPWFVFNPRGSYLWKFPQWKEWAWHEVQFDACEFGGSRRIPQRIRCSVDWLSKLVRSCSGTHPHSSRPLRLKNGKIQLGPSMDDICPQGLCKEIAEALVLQCPSCKSFSKEGEAFSAFSFAAAAHP